jgi:hypothetical protein
MTFVWSNRYLLVTKLGWEISWTGVFFSSA